MSICLSVRLSVRISVCLSVCLSVCPSVYLSVCLSICPSVRLCVSLCVSLSVVCLSVCLSVCPSLFTSVSLPDCLSVYICNKWTYMAFLHSEASVGPLRIIYNYFTGRVRLFNVPIGSQPPNACKVILKLVARHWMSHYLSHQVDINRAFFIKGTINPRELKLSIYLISLLSRLHSEETKCLTPIA